MAGHAREESLPPQHALPHMQHHNSFAHIQQPMASVSPPMPNGMFQPRHPTPQPPHMISRPPSQNMVRRTSSNLVPLQQPHPTPPPPQNGFAYVPNPPIYNPQAAAIGPPHPSPQPQYQQFPPQQHQHAQPTPPPPTQSHQQMQQAHQQYLQEQRRASQPPPPPPTISQPTLQPPAQPQPRASPRPENQSLRPPEQGSPPQPKHVSSKSRSIFTPIDEGGSVLAQHFFGAPDPPKPKREEDLADIKPPPRSITVPSIPRPSSQPNSRSQTTVPEFAPPQRTNTSGSKSGARPKLNLQIPSEAEDNDSPSGGSPLQSAGPSANPARGGDHIVLPPPSPSASAVMSAGASGPPNPFARPPPPTSNQNRDAYSDNRNNIETPISALPSRYMNNDLLPSPSNFFSEWYDSGRNPLNSAVLPSPLVFPTPADARSGLGFSNRDASNESNGEKRKTSIDMQDREGDAKKVKT